MRLQFCRKALSGFARLAAAVSLVLASGYALAEGPDFEFLGGASVFFQKDFNGQSRSAGRSLERPNDQIALEWAELSVRRSVAPVDIRLDLLFGEIASRLSVEDDPTKNLGQAYFSYSPTALPEFTFKAGKFYSWMGLERVRPVDNLNVSRSFAFNYGLPIWHQGVLLSYQIWPEALTAGFAVVNGWSGALSSETNKSQSMGGFLETHWIYGLDLRYGFISGNELENPNQVRQAHELRASYFVNDWLSIAMDLLYGSQSHAPIESGETNASWLGWALYGRVSPSKNLAFALRFERFEDRSGFALNSFTEVDPDLAQSISAVTLTSSYEFDPSFLGRLEYRMDKSDRSGFFVSREGTPTDFDNTLSVQAIAEF